MKEEKIRLKGHMRTHKALIKSIIRTRKFEISCISAPQPVKGREDGYCYMYIDGYPTVEKLAGCRCVKRKEVTNYVGTNH